MPPFGGCLPSWAKQQRLNKSMKGAHDQCLLKCFSFSHRGWSLQGRLRLRSCWHHKKRSKYSSSSLLLKGSFPIFSSQGIAFVAVAREHFIALTFVYHLPWDVRCCQMHFQRYKMQNTVKLHYWKNMILPRYSGNWSPWLLLMQRSCPNLLLYL